MTKIHITDKDDIKLWMKWAFGCTLLGIGIIWTIIQPMNGISPFLIGFGIGYVSSILRLKK